MTTAAPALFRRTGGEDFPDRLKVMVSGPPKSGKTTLLGTVPNIVIADTEPHANNLQSIAHKNLPFVTVNATMDLHRLLLTLRDDSMRRRAADSLGMPDIEAVAIDTLDSLQKIMKRERMREQRTSKFLRDDWGWLKEEMNSVLTAFTSLPLHVFFMVHLKTKEIGTEDNPQTIILPGLEGAIAEDIAGMVGYSLLSFRKQEIRPDGSPYTKYWLRAEGDETYNFLGNRAAGRLPDVIEPNFSAIYDAAVAGRRAVNTVAQPTPLADVQQTQAPVPQPPAPAQTAPPATPQQAAQNVGHQSAPQAAPAEASPAPAVQPPAQAAPAEQHATPSGQPAETKPGDAEPVNAAALTFCKRVYDAVGLEFPEELIRGITLGEARHLVKFWQAIQQDAVEGKLEASPADEMAGYLHAQGWLTDRDRQRIDHGAANGSGVIAAPNPPAAPTPDLAGTVEQVMAWVDGELTRAQEAYELEIKKNRPRATLINALTNLGVQVQTPAQNSAPAQAAPAPSQEVTTAAPVADDQVSEDQQQRAEALLAQELGAVPIGADGQPLPCEQCGQPVDDEDIATLSKARYNRRLCVADYLTEGKKPRG